MTPDEILEMDEAIRLVIDRMANANWIAESRVSPGEASVKLTEPGRAGCFQLQALMKLIGWPENAAQLKALRHIIEVQPESKTEE